MRWIVIFCCLLTACRESEETKKHRFLLKGNAALEDQHDDVAVRYFNEALQIDSCFADAHNNLGTVYFRQREYSRALEYYTRSIACNPDFTQAY
ncbi:MAG: tetratricopeptide repeat protein, partial [Cyclobacteriaceae bacterium]